jgi:hypothetical protein
MNLQELEGEINKHSIKKEFYGINKKPFYEGTYIIQEDTWKVYYYERGSSNLLKEFSDKSEAAEFMLGIIKKHYPIK